MKKLLSLLCLSALLAQAQPYGERLYQHPKAILSFGTPLTLNSKGFLMSGYVQSAAVGSANFFMDATGPGGLFSTSSATFSGQYIVQGIQTCTALTQAVNLVGVTHVETSGGGIGGWYAVAGAYEQGCFFGLLGSAGNVISKKLYTLAGSWARPTKPIIIRGLNPKEYYMCGTFNMGGTNVVYINRIHESGSLLSSQIYTHPNPTRGIVATDFILSPYSPSGFAELVVVGTEQDPSGSGTRGFAMRVNANTLTSILSYATFGHPAGTTGNDGFNSIAIANSPNFFKGFVVGGTSDLSPGNGPVWALKLDPGCTTVGWSSIINSFVDPGGTRNMIDVTERFSSTFGYTYYGAVTSSKGMLVQKLDDSGNPFMTVPPLTNTNEFLYRGIVSSLGGICNVTFLDNGGPTDIGIHAYGTNPLSGGGNFHLAEATFNGDADYGLTGCTNSSVYVGATNVHPTVTVSSGFIQTNSNLKMCDNFALLFHPVTPVVNTMCSINTLPPHGSNARVTGIEQLSDNQVFRVSPNPVSDQLEIMINANESDKVEIRVFDYLGRVISTMPEIRYTNGSASATIDMSRLNIESGIYMISTSVNGASSTQKIIYTRGQ